MRKVLTFASVVALVFAPAAFGADSMTDSSTIRVAGEKQDSGLGELPADYTAAEFQGAGVRIAGEKLDSGLGDLPSDYTAAEFLRDGYRVIGEKRDSGLGELSLNTYLK